MREVIDRSPEVLEASTPFPRILDLVVNSRHTEFFVVDGEGRLLGSIALDELRRLIFEQEAFRHLVVAADLVEEDRPMATENDPLDWVVQLMGGRARHRARRGGRPRETEAGGLDRGARPHARLQPRGAAA